MVMPLRSVVGAWSGLHVHRLARCRLRCHTRKMKKLISLWQGHLSLRDAFWDWVVLGGLLVNVTTSILLLVLLTYDQPWAALIVGKGCSLPYNLMVTVGVWRSAMHHDGPAMQAHAARIATLILMIVMSLT